MKSVKTACLILSAALLGLGVLGCDTKKKLDEMHENTMKMGRTTERMEATTKQMAGRTDKMYVGLREAESIGKQDEFFNQMVQQPGANAKALYGSLFFAAMEFQVWYPWPTEGFNDREVLFSKALDVFFGKVADLVRDDMPIEDLFASNEWTVLSLLAVTMSKISDGQQSRAKEFNFTPVSVYDLIKEGLAAKADYLAGKEIAPYKLKVLRYESKARYLLQLRHNYYKALVLSQLTNAEEGFLQRAWMFTAGWRADMEKFEDAEIRQLNEYLWKAAETQHYMRSIGMNVIHNGNINHLFNRGEFYFENQQVTPALGLVASGDLVPLAHLNSVNKSDAMASFLALVPKVLDERGPWINQRPQ